jgi:Coenzyme PQQ synthesis protein D (PqqD)
VKPQGSKSKFGQNEDSFLQNICLGLSSSPLSSLGVTSDIGRITMTVGNTHLYTVVDQDGAAILDIEHGLISTLNPTGAYVWQGLERGETLETIISSLVTETGEEPLVVERDVREFIETLKENHLLSH